MESQIGLMLDSLYAFLSEQVLYSTIAGAVALAVISVFKVKNPVLVLGLWSLVLLRLVLPTDLASPLSFRSVADRLDIAGFVDRMKPEGVTGASPAPVIDLPLIQAPRLLGGEESAAAWQTESVVADAKPGKSWQVSHQSQPYRAEKPALAVWQPASPAAPEKAATPDGTLSWKQSLVLAWLAIAAFMGVRFYLRSASYSRIMKAARRSDDPVIADMADRWQKQFGIRRSVTVVAGRGNGAGFPSPFTTGLFRPVIYLPADIILSKAPKRDRLRALDVVIGHEMAHIKRCDALWVKLENILQVLFFFHPVVWFARTQIDLAREKICDRMVLHVGAVEPRRYLGGLVDAVRMSMGQEVIDLSRKKRSFAGVPVPSFNPALVKLRERITALKGEEAMKPLRVAPITIAIAALAACTMPMAATGQSQTETAVSQESKPLDPKAVTEAFEAKESNPVIVKERRVTRNVERKIIKNGDGGLIIEGYRPMRITGNGMGGLVIEDADGRRVVGPDGRAMTEVRRGRHIQVRPNPNANSYAFAYRFDEDAMEEMLEFQEEYQENLAEAMSDLGDSMAELHANRWEVLGDVMGELGDLQGELAEFNVEFLGSPDFDAVIDDEDGFVYYFDDDDLEDLSDEEREQRIAEREQRRAEMRAKREEMREKMRERVEQDRERIAAMKEYLKSEEFRSKMEESRRAMDEAMKGLREFQKSYSEKNDQ